MQREARKIRSRAFFSIVEPANLKCGPAVGSIRCDTSSEGLGLPSFTSALGRCFSLMTRRAHTDGDLLLGMLALERGLIDQEQLLGAFSAWNGGEGRSMAEILVEQGS